ncbi:hypothetical protein GCM10009734_81660 [Nonomuraea bangladeshensis]
MRDNGPDRNLASVARQRIESRRRHRPGGRWGRENVTDIDGVCVIIPSPAPPAGPSRTFLPPNRGPACANALACVSGQPSYHHPVRRDRQSGTVFHPTGSHVASNSKRV